MTTTPGRVCFHFRNMKYILQKITTSQTTVWHYLVICSQTIILFWVLLFSLMLTFDFSPHALWILNPFPGWCPIPRHDLIPNIKLIHDPPVTCFIYVSSKMDVVALGNCLMSPTGTTGVPVCKCRWWSLSDDSAWASWSRWQNPVPSPLPSSSCDHLGEGEPAAWQPAQKKITQDIYKACFQPNNKRILPTTQFNMFSVTNQDNNAPKIETEPHFHHSFLNYLF